LEQVTKQLFKLINVVKISELDPAEATERELVLATVRAEPRSRGEVIELVQVFEGRIVDVGYDQLTVMLAGAPSKLDDFEDLMRSYGIIELQRTGRGCPPQARAPGATPAQRERGGGLRGRMETWPRSTTRRTPTLRCSPAGGSPSSDTDPRAMPTR